MIASPDCSSVSGMTWAACRSGLGTGVIASWMIAKEGPMGFLRRVDARFPAKTFMRRIRDLEMAVVSLRQQIDDLRSLVDRDDAGSSEHQTETGGVPPASS